LGEHGGEDDKPSLMLESTRLTFAFDDIEFLEFKIDELFSEGTRDLPEFEASIFPPS
jgi:hypothetical protein